MDYLDVCHSVSKCLEIFFLLLVFSLILSIQLISLYIPCREHMLYNLNLKNLLRLVLWSWCGLFWYMFHEHLKGMYILLFWGGMFYKYQFDSIGKDLVELFHILASFLYICSVNCWERGFDVPIYNYKFFYCSISFCFTYFTALLFGAYTLRISIFWRGWVVLTHLPCNNPFCLQ